EEQNVPRKLSPDEISELLDQARAELGLHGEVHQVFDGVEWRARSSLGVSILTLRPRVDATRIALTTERLDQAVAIGMGSVAIGPDIGSPGQLNGCYKKLRQSLDTDLTDFHESLGSLLACTKPNESKMMLL